MFAFDGLTQTTDAEVLDNRDEPIPGLYVAGNSARDLLYDNYAGGTGEGNAMVFGKIAGDQAAQESENR